MCGGGGGRRALGWGPGADPMAQTTLDMPRTHEGNPVHAQNRMQH
ncbi:hypothetical protein HMPREF1137_1992 [Actinomyces sp. ICM39]|nr:hypothetical protein HMPREF1137_1992 [Actinomyces sp. ICM39]